MFGTKPADAQLLEAMIEDIFDIAEGKRNRYRYSGAEFADRKLEKVSNAIHRRLASLIESKQKDMLAMGELILALDQMKSGIFKPSEIDAHGSEMSVIASSFNAFTLLLSERFVQIVQTLSTYSTNDFTPRLSEGELQGELASLIRGVNNLADEITQMLSDSLRNGLDLQNEAAMLREAMERLSNASNEQAANLEETAAAMEEMTGNVQGNAQKANDMARMAAQTDDSAKQGAALADKTAQAMTEIQEATRSINNAVAIIENIAFQTNILSLNAAVEAATAGEAGKGFAVVAQEVRNLANRSADAAKEIKSLAEQAAAKSDEGMNIAGDLTKGFEVIAEKIEQTTMLVQDVSNASREQMQGIGQINTAITQLDQMTQENAKIAANVTRTAETVQILSDDIYRHIESKQFRGKHELLGGRRGS
ncbi:chemotaxis protein [Sulfuricurvum sp. IAE1]|uniref:methyl-accepting chemotaxis protein n=1 Tax=Sulfuricurvum sp. IAE1 TaxID=2546102 RepID=UPI001046AE97|nr:methyl-accepting chemotaxis protein [Sulfuricurvum sp. IAE1]TDA63212.1 chemotaxis protein [Sulfuricurvum sp. IAE1]